MPLTIGSKEVLASHNKNPVINIKIPAKIHLRRHYYISASKGYRVTTRKCNLFCEKSTLTDTINLATKMLWILPFILKIPNHHFLKNSRLKNSQFAQAESRGATGVKLSIHPASSGVWKPRVNSVSAQQPNNWIQKKKTFPDLCCKYFSSDSQSLDPDSSLNAPGNCWRRKFSSNQSFEKCKLKALQLISCSSVVLLLSEEDDDDVVELGGKDWRKMFSLGSSQGILK